MNNAIVKKEEPQVVQGFDLDPETVKKYIAKGATDEELFMFLGICKSYGLNPFKREIHFIKYDQKSPASIVVGYETYLKRAVATGKLDGWRVWIEGKGEDMKAVIEIKRKDWSEPFRWEVHRREFDTGKSSWKKMPTFMLKKVAIAQGFRLAFPEDLGGMPYIPEEVDVRAEVVEESQTPPPTTQPKTKDRSALIARFKELYEKLRWSPEEGRAFIRKLFGKESTKDLTTEELARAIERMAEMLEQAEQVYEEDIPVVSEKGHSAQENQEREASHAGRDHHRKEASLAETWQEIHATVQKAGFQWEAVQEEIKKRYGVDDPDRLTAEQAREFLMFLKEHSAV